MMVYSANDKKMIIKWLLVNSPNQQKSAKIGQNFIGMNIVTSYSVNDKKMIL